MTKVSIVIPNFNRYDLVHNLLFDLYKNCDVSRIEEVIVVNDGCTEEESFSGLTWWETTKMLPVKELRLEDNVGFLLASNAGMKSATGDIICLISNDVRVKGDIVDYALENTFKFNSDLLLGGRLLAFNTGWNTFGDKVFPYIEGWLLISPKNSWESMKYFDERFVPNDYEDVDLSATAMSLGYSLIQLPEEMTYHHGAQSIGYNPERESLTKRNREKFRKKWKLP